MSPCTNAEGLQKCIGDPTDPEDIRQAMLAVNRLIDLTVASDSYGGDIVFDEDDTETDRRVTDAADGVSVVRAVRFHNGIDVPRRGPQAGVLQSAPNRTTLPGGKSYWLVKVKNCDIFGTNVTGDELNVYADDSGVDEPMVTTNDVIFYGTVGGDDDRAGHLVMLGIHLQSHVHAGTQVKVVDGITTTYGNYGFSGGDGATVKTNIQTADGGDHYHTFTITPAEVFDQNYNSDPPTAA